MPTMPNGWRYACSESGYQARNAETQLTALRQSLASMLSDAFTSVAPTEDGIKARIQELLNVNKDKLQTSKDSEEKLKMLSKQFQSQYEAHHEAERRSRLSEQQVAAALERVRALEQELAAGDVIRDGLRADKDKVPVQCNCLSTKHISITSSNVLLTSRRRLTAGLAMVAMFRAIANKRHSLSACEHTVLVYRWHRSQRTAREVLLKRPWRRWATRRCAVRGSVRCESEQWALYSHGACAVAATTPATLR